LLHLVKKEEINKENKYDVVDFNNRNKDNISLQSIKKKLVSQINEETDAEKINRIKESINNKTYSIDVEEIVKRLLK
jgi:anti-sigma28 factor (negative regulator of flagellin synthesis)